LSLPDAQTRVGTLGTIAAVARDLPSPSLIVVGDVVASSARLQDAVAQAQRAA
jgi:siroheme synthase